MAKKCNQTNCENDATYEYVWPTDGETKYSCLLHALAARNICQALGYRVVLKELDVPNEQKS
jgi:hypothetical protein